VRRFFTPSNLTDWAGRFAKQESKVSTCLPALLCLRGPFFYGLPSGDLKDTRGLRKYWLALFSLVLFQRSFPVASLITCSRLSLLFFVKRLPYAGLFFPVDHILPPHTRLHLISVFSFRPLWPLGEL